MDLSQYRQQVAADIEAAEQQQTSFRDLLHESEGGAAPAVTGPPADDAAAASEVVLDKNRDSRLRLAAIQVISDELGQHPDLLNPVLALFRDPSEPRDLRLAALRVVQQASFQLASFAGNRADYLETLRSVVNDADAEVR